MDTAEGAGLLDETEAQDGGADAADEALASDEEALVSDAGALNRGVHANGAGAGAAVALTVSILDAFVLSAPLHVLPLYALLQPAQQLVRVLRVLGQPDLPGLMSGSRWWVPAAASARL